MAGLSRSLRLCGTAAAGGRPLHTAPITFAFVKNIYKKVNYSAPFPETSKVTILEKLNRLSTEDLNSYLSKKMSKAITVHRVKNGDFECVEQLLDLNKVDPGIVEKTCALLQKPLQLDDLEPEALEEVSMVKYKNMFSRDLVPRVNMKYFSGLTNPTMVGIFVRMDKIYFAMVDGTGKLIEWQVCENSDPYAVNHPNLHQVASRVEELLPQADFYLLEETPQIQSKDQALKARLNLTRLRMFLMTMLMERRQGPKGFQKVHTIKPGVLDFMFNLKEKDSKRKTMEDLLEGQKCLQISGKLPVLVEDRQWSEFRAWESTDREAVLQCVARATAFHHLCSLTDKEEF